jgi:hypothetical protein
MGRNPETSEATAPNALKRVNLIGLLVSRISSRPAATVPRAKAGHMTAPFQCVKSTEKALATRAVPHIGTHLCRKFGRERKVQGPYSGDIVRGSAALFFRYFGRLFPGYLAIAAVMTAHAFPPAQGGAYDRPEQLARLRGQGSWLLEYGRGLGLPPPSQNGHRCRARGHWSR